MPDDQAVDARLVPAAGAVRRVPRQELERTVTILVDLVAPVVPEKEREALGDW